MLCCNYSALNPLNAKPRQRTHLPIGGRPESFMIRKFAVFFCVKSAPITVRAWRGGMSRYLILAMNCLLLLLPDMIKKNAWALDKYLRNICLKPIIQCHFIHPWVTIQYACRNKLNITLASYNTLFELYRLRA